MTATSIGVLRLATQRLRSETERLHPPQQGQATLLGLVSSLLARRRHEAEPADGADLGGDARFWGDCIPIFVDDTLSGTVATSVEPDVVDNESTVETVRRYLELERR